MFARVYTSECAREKMNETREANAPTTTPPTTTTAAAAGLGEKAQRKKEIEKKTVQFFLTIREREDAKGKVLAEGHIFVLCRVSV